MLDGLNYHLRQALKKQFQTIANEIIEEAIRDAMKTFETSVNQYARLDKMDNLIEVVLRDNRTEQRK